MPSIFPRAYIYKHTVTFLRMKDSTGLHSTILSSASILQVEKAIAIDPSYMSGHKTLWIGYSWSDCTKDYYGRKYSHTILLFYYKNSYLCKSN